MTRIIWGLLPLILLIVIRAWPEDEPLPQRPQPARSSNIEIGVSSVPFSGSSGSSVDSPPSSIDVDDAALIRSLADCQRQPVPLVPGLSVASWNLRWFPRAAPDARVGGGTDVAWMACVLARLGAPIIAVQEVLDGPSDRKGQAALLRALDAATGGVHRILLDRCPAEAQHVGIIYDEKRAQLLDHEVVAAVNPTGSACGGQLRPGYAARFRSLVDDSGTLTVVAVHLDSGSFERDHRHRQQALRALRDYVDGRPEGERVLVTGDFNTMGCSKCEPVVASEAEWARMGPLSGLRRLSAKHACSHYFHGDPGWLDHALWRGPGAMPRLSLHGPCAARACGPLDREAKAFFSALSDHCPLRVVLPGVH